MNPENNEAALEPTAPAQGEQHLIPDGPSQEAWQELAAATSTAPESLSEYRFPHDPEFSPDSAEADRELRGWLQNADIPAGIGSHLADVAEDWVKRTEGWSDAQHELERRSSMISLERLWGDRAGEMIDLARSAVARLDKQHNGKVSAFLEESQLGNCTQLIAQLAMNEQRRMLAGR